jgi:8-oxo-dGTP diphosphatase
MSVYDSLYDPIFIAIDSIIFGFDQGKLKLLLIKRKMPPMEGQWSLMGGFVAKNESLDEAAYRILEDLTGLQSVFLEQLYTYGDLDRDPAARVVSVAYYALINIDNYDTETGERHGAQWFSIDEIPRLVFDHQAMVHKALRRLKRKTLIQPIGFELLPQKFTLTQLQLLYEAIHQRELDKRNFRKKIVAVDILTKLEEKDKESSKKGAYLFKFNKEKYDYLSSKDNLFDFV